MITKNSVWLEIALAEMKLDLLNHNVASMKESRESAMLQAKRSFSKQMQDDLLQSWNEKIEEEGEKLKSVERHIRELKQDLPFLGDL